MSRRCYDGRQTHAVDKPRKREPQPVNDLLPGAKKSSAGYERLGEGSDNEIDVVWIFAKMITDPPPRLPSTPNECASSTNSRRYAGTSAKQLGEIGNVSIHAVQAFHNNKAIAEAAALFLENGFQMLKVVVPKATSSAFAFLAPPILL